MMNMMPLNFSSNRYQPRSSTHTASQARRFQQDLLSARAAYEPACKPGMDSPDPGAPTLQYYYKEYVKGSASLNTPLSDEQLQALAKDFDPNHMTQDSFASFTNHLVEMGLFTKEELDSVTQGESRIVGQCDPASSYLPFDGPLAFGKDGEMQEWANANYNLLRGSAVAADQKTVFSKQKADVLMRLMPLLEKVATSRG